jgi:uncharacterized protein YpuA (DUF1002 family)
MPGLKKYLTSLLLCSLLSSGALLAAAPPHVGAADPSNVDYNEVVTLGANLNQSQKNEMFSTFGVSENDSKVKVLEVTNQEERQYLKGLVPDKQIGTRAISSVYVKILDKGSGIEVKTKNITFVNEQAYANALVTAEIKDAQVYAAAPFPVSGTAALTGLFKAYEAATGKDIPEEAKKVATEELVTTSEIGEETGEEKAVSELVSRVKEQVVAENLNDPEEIKKVVEDVAKDMDVKLTPGQIDKIVALMQKISKLDLDIGTLKNQLEDVRSKLKDYLGGEKSGSAWQKVVDFFTSLWDKIKGYF